MKPNPLVQPMQSLGELRGAYHREICKHLLANRSGVPNIADVGSKQSKEISRRLVKQLGHRLCRRPPSGQTAGSRFTSFTRDYLDAAFRLLHHLRPGDWLFSASQAGEGIGAYDQYEHLTELVRTVRQHKELAAALGVDYLVTPDIVIGRKPVEDAEINAEAEVVGESEEVAGLTPLRAANSSAPRLILHASVSCKWPIRSNRAQNARTEALNLIRNRKGKTPHIVAVVAEPLPSRIASIAMGTSDIDCVHHMALHELQTSVIECEFEGQLDLLETLVLGRRLRDISDLPFDLVT